jgi:hypothetical protein
LSDTAAASASIAAPAASDTAPASDAAAPSDATAPHDAGLPPIVYRHMEMICGNFDMPTFFVLDQPGPENGKGWSWSWGDRATIGCSWIWNAANMSAKDVCKSTSEKLVGSYVSGNMCFQTTRGNGKIGWSKTFTYSDDAGSGVIDELDFTYDESLKEAFDPIVQRLAASYR